MGLRNATQHQEVNRRRQLVSKLRHEGVKAQSEIVKRLDSDYGITVTQQTISTDLKALDHLWKQTAIENTDKWKMEVLSQYRFLYQQSVSAWELSLEDAEETTTGGKDGTTEKTKGQSGNPAHLKNAQDSLKAIRDLLGLDSPLKQELAGPGGKDIGISIAEWRQQQNKQKQAIDEVEDTFGSIEN